MSETPPARRGRLPIVLATACTLLAAGVAFYVRTVRAQSTLVGLRAEDEPIGGLAFVELEKRVDLAITKFLDGEITITFGSDSRRVTRRAIGISVDARPLIARARAIGHSGRPWKDLPALIAARGGRLNLSFALVVDDLKAVDQLTALKDELDRAAVDARLDLENHRVSAESPGLLVSVYDSLIALQYAARAGKSTFALVSRELPPKVSAASLATVDISTVLGNWETRYSANAVDSDRTYNLKVGADHLNGHMLMPHQLFSFNETVGNRTEKEGYRVAPVIAGGELIDGLAGGMCQIASTLHAAAFFAGLEIVSSTPHSRPSSYITMGLDSTVVYPSVDLKIRNPYDFPIVMHYKVNQGSVKVELLGKERPYRVVFEREIKSESGFGAQTRYDVTAPAGQRLILQAGYPGYGLIRRRYIFDAKTAPRLGAPGPIADLIARQHLEPVSKQQWTLHYPSTTQITAIGTGPATLKPKPPPPAHRIPPVSPREKPFFQILK